MSAAGAAMWGLFAALALECLDLLGALRRAGRPPWRGAGEPGGVPYAISAAVRCLAGAGLAAAVAAAGQVSTAGGAAAVGLAAPLLLTQLVRLARPAVVSDVAVGTDAAVPAGASAPLVGTTRPSRLRVKLPAARKKTGDDHRAG
ncbi:hypothetical protein OHA72_31360 [Dactylosporangium sp. NBC_01737]|uniref:hypothetical protein n=1 Tax=Dactylosporangium sp. NBC_01737 TaxID=2975959 RepID=UPI002E11D374|nr:hypothetical protein OHA72_31360 [Dactylosporangium sp. NBC_01737]